MVNGMMPCRAGGADKVCYRGGDDCRKWRWQRAKGGQKAGGLCRARAAGRSLRADGLRREYHLRAVRGLAILAGCQAPGLAQGGAEKL